MCCMENWLQSDMPDSLFEISGFSLVRANRDANSGKYRGGGISGYINDLWCWQYTVKETICDPNVQMPCMSLGPFYILREFDGVLLCVVYVPPSSKAGQAATTISEHVHKLQQTHPEAPTIVLGD